MKLKNKLAAVSLVAALASTGANAAWESAGGSTLAAPADGELILTVWNEDTQFSFSQDLGVTTRQFMTGSAAFQNFALDSAALGALGTGTIRYSVAGQSSVFNPGAGGPADLANVGYYFTSNETPIGNATITNAAFQSNFGRISTYENALLADGTRDGGTDADPVYFLNGQFYAGSGATWGAQLNGITSVVTDNGVNTTALASETLTAWAVGADPDFAGAVVKQDLGLWSLDLSGGQLSYSAIPIPAAVWLFGSALLGMFGASRRRKLK